jgi:hypothetical protein
MVKDLTNQYWDNLFKDNFTNEEIIILNKEMKESKNEEVLAMLQVTFSIFFFHNNID